MVSGVSKPLWFTPLPPPLRTAIHTAAVSIPKKQASRPAATTFASVDHLTQSDQDQLSQDLARDRNSLANSVDSTKALSPAAWC